MKKIVIGLLLAFLQVFSVSGGGIAKTENEKIPVIVEFNIPESEDMSAYAVQCTGYVKNKFSGVELDYIYDTLICGFGGAISKTDAALLSQCDFVKEIYECSEYVALEYDTFEFSQNVYDSLASQMIGYTDEIKSNLSGEGVIVAVIDNGFDVSHDAFKNEVTNVIDIDALALSFGNKRPHAFMSLANPFDIYYSDRIPFVFDYADKDTDVSNPTSSHGTHVAGIIGAAPTEKSDMCGLAPNCQFMFMKIFNEKTGTAPDSALIAAIEDAIRVGADVINLSLGTYAGSVSSNSVDIDNIFRKAEEMGCIIVSSAGNDRVSTSKSEIFSRYGIENPPADYTDYGTVSFPASTEYILAVGSVDGKICLSPYFRHAVNKNLIFDYTDTGILKDGELKFFMEAFDGETLDYVEIPGIGEESDYRGIDVKGKLALIERGGISFTDKVNIAAKMGAVGAIIYNNVNEKNFYIDITGATVPAIAISAENGEILKKQNRCTLEFDSDFNVRLRETGIGLISEFSSWGVTPALTLKPDICAVGGGVISTVGGNSYGGMSGTSMASPQVTGILALMSENAKKQGTVSENELVKEMKITLMNSATPVIQPNGVEYSPRAQGAGLVNLQAVANTPLKLTYGDTGLAKAELYDKLSGEINFEVTLENTSDSDIKVSVNASLTTDGYKAVCENGKYVYYSTLVSEADRNSSLTVLESANINKYSKDCSPAEITLKAGEIRKLPIKICLDEEYHKNLREVFTNGYFIEGFVECSFENGSISMPYVGYAGDWTKGSIIDGDMSGEDNTIFGGTGFFLELSEGEYVVAGQNIFNQNGEFYSDKIAFSPNGDKRADAIYFSAPQIRNAKGIKINVKDGDGKVIISSAEKYISKAKSFDDIRKFIFNWTGSDGIYLDYILPDGAYTVNFEYTLDYDRAEPQKFTYPVIIDTKMPEIRSISLKGNNLIIDAKDNNEVFCISIYSGDKKGAYMKTAESDTARFDISDYSGNLLYYDVIDSAYNILVGKIYLSDLRQGK